MFTYGKIFKDATKHLPKFQRPFYRNWQLNPNIHEKTQESIITKAISKKKIESSYFSVLKVATKLLSSRQCGSGVCIDLEWSRTERLK